MRVFHDTIRLHGRKVVGGVAEGEALVTREHISGWGGIDSRSGTIVETRHELRGQSFAGKVLVFPGAKGSSGWSNAFHLTRTMGSAPAAFGSPGTDGWWTQIPADNDYPYLVAEGFGWHVKTQGDPTSARWPNVPIFLRNITPEQLADDAAPGARVAMMLPFSCRAYAQRPDSASRIHIVHASSRA